MKRRAMLRGLLGTAGATATGFRLPLDHAADYGGKLFVFVQADGGSAQRASVVEGLQESAIRLSIRRSRFWTPRPGLPPAL